MTTLEDLMNRNWMVASYEGHAVFWNHSSRAIMSFLLNWEY
jgi:hypothetical protein